jgi:hypothetical protein
MDVFEEIREDMVHKHYIGSFVRVGVCSVRARTCRSGKCGCI